MNNGKKTVASFWASEKYYIEHNSGKDHYSETLIPQMLHWVEDELTQREQAVLYTWDFSFLLNLLKYFCLKWKKTILSIFSLCQSLITVIQETKRKKKHLQFLNLSIPDQILRWPDSEAIF